MREGYWMSTEEMYSAYSSLPPYDAAYLALTGDPHPLARVAQLLGGIE